ncbi:MAG: hypothetical protein PHN34_08795, partial [Kiritimatiellae bacterium]|nr:hypothetical protein [Kiritimatiellia bacterium]
ILILILHIGLSREYTAPMKTSFDHEKPSVYQKEACLRRTGESDVGAHRLDAGGLDPQHLR